ncbi:alpha-amylase family glycosyl hydrolase [Flavobacterium sp. UBA6135]|uniref:alpha-amylase family glycosyl hydrolase n=1 Tax=Flavobacterium sp. UBA6135 TaxID=1946553 RepID=UPI0025C00736|nr:alpha-amylase family glycosyl hydrolase [Flavobacterium sp. UBA6135]
MKTLQFFTSIFIAGLVLGCNSTETKKTEIASEDRYIPKEYVQVKHPEWSKNAAIYQLNTRQFSEEGTFRAAQKELPRLREMGIDIIWLMPINPIGEKNRKGTLGSPYSVKDYYGVNPEFGTLDDLKAFVKEAHELGMYVILDWVANHTAWDNNLVNEHPEWYKRDYKGNFRPTPWWDWDDIIDLDYSKPELRKYMTEAMKYWVKEADIDGYRCDVAGFVPIDFWDNLRTELDAIKPVFMLAEWESRDMHAHAFDMTYAWSWNEKLHKICKGQADVNELYIYYSWNESFFPDNSIRMTFVSNHDKNAWEGTMWEQFGDGVEAAIVLSVVGDGMPLIYNGQEAGEPKRLAFFEKDPIVWKPHPIGDLYKKLFALMKKNTALWHADWGALMIKVPNTNEKEVFSFVRQNEKDKVFCVFNFSANTQNVTLKEDLYHGTYRDFTTQEMITFNEDTTFSMAPWTYKVFVKE